jgi:hypothetical protein
MTFQNRPTRGLEFQTKKRDEAHVLTMDELDFPHRVVDYHTFPSLTLMLIVKTLRRSGFILLLGRRVC